AGANRVRANDRANHTNGPNQQWENHALMAKACVTENHRGNDGDFITLEYVSRHAGAVTHVVADVIGNRGSISWIVFGNVRFDLAHESSPHVGRFRVNPPADTHEQSQKRAAETEAKERFVGLFTEVEEDE